MEACGSRLAVYPESGQSVRELPGGLGPLPSMAASWAECSLHVDSGWLGVWSMCVAFAC